MTLRRSVAILALLLVVAACSAEGAGTTSDSPSPPTADDGPVWRTASLRDTLTGETFFIDELQGKLVVIEPMAVWCTNCRIQQLEAASALAELDHPDIVYVSLGVDPNEREEDLAEYAETWEFDWRFVVADTEVARSLVEEFGPQILSPPSTPQILVGPDGTVVDQHFGIRGASDLVELFRQHLS